MHFDPARVAASFVVGSICFVLECYLPSINSQFVGGDARQAQNTICESAFREALVYMGGERYGAGSQWEMPSDGLQSLNNHTGNLPSSDVPDFFVLWMNDGTNRGSSINNAARKLVRGVAAGDCDLC